MAKHLRRADVPTVGDIRITHGLIYSAPGVDNKIKYWNAEVYCPLQYDTDNPKTVKITVKRSQSFTDCMKNIHLAYLEELAL